MSISDIKSALQAEMKAIPEFYVFKVLQTTQLKHGLLLDVQSRPKDGDPQAVLDESLCGTRTWWARPVKGAATVQKIDPIKNQILLVKHEGIQPLENQDILLYPRNYIKPLLKCWEDDQWAARAFDCLKDLSHPQPIASARLTGDFFKNCRQAQLLAFNLVHHSSSFLWGPPGTGKTTTLGALIAEYLLANPLANVLLLSTTNRAVDEATLAVDSAMKSPQMLALHRTIRRIGKAFNPKLYIGREYLLEDHLQQSVSKYDETDPTESGLISPQELGIQDEHVLGNIRLRTMTIASAIYSIGTLQKLPPFDLLVLDEASQISLAHTLAVLPLGKARLFAGDPMQLSPIAQSPSMAVQRWLTQSAFAYRPLAAPSVCQLIEQSRMAPPICEIISEAFYDGNLRVATAALNDVHWIKAREHPFGSIAPNQHVCIQTTSTDAIWSQKNHGWTRQESAESIIQMILSAISHQHVAEKHILVITPFRLQRALLRDLLDQQYLNAVSVSTVHAVQGAQNSVVIFDPVRGADTFLMNQVGRQLINVALSRAQSKLILTLSAQDLTNPLFRQMDSIVQRQASRAAKHLPQVAQPNFITRAVGERAFIQGQGLKFDQTNLY